MKKLLLLIAVAGITFGLASCGECVDCSGSDCTTDEICRDDYQNKASYNAAIDIEEFGDCSCK